MARCCLLLSGLVMAITALERSQPPAVLGDESQREKPDGRRPDIAPPSKEELADQRIVFMKTALSHYTVQVGDREEPAKAADPCLRFTNALTDVTDGIMSVYTFEGGRPAAIGQFFRNGPRSWVNEFAIVADSEVAILRAGRPFWKPSEYVCRFTDLPKSLVPAAKPALRLAQMRAIAADFSVIDRFGSTQITEHNLRLLPQPAYRYSEEGRILDGGLFVFALGTNPECCLLLEAYEEGDAVRYRYALTPMSIYELEARYKEVPVWSIERRMIFGDACRAYYALVYAPEPDETVPE